MKHCLGKSRIAGAVVVAVISLASARAEAQCVPAPVAGAEAEPFKDMPKGSLGYQEAILLQQAGITSGCSASPALFCPSCSMTRGSFIVFAVAAAKLPLVDPPTPTFTDVPKTHGFYKFVETAVANNITGGCAPQKFCPDDLVTRGQAAVFTVNAAKLPKVAPPTATFSDVPTTDPFYSFVEGIKASCVASGCSANAFCPNDPVTRAQAAVFIAHAFDLGGINPCISGGGTGGTGGNGGTGGSADGGGLGGAAGAAGASGSAGAAGTAAGGSGGVATGGAGGTSSGATGSGASASGGAPGGSGGAPAGGGSKSDSGSEDSGGCSCSVPARTTGLVPLLGLLGLFWMRRMRRGGR